MPFKPTSIGRPWILYEAGVAKGKLDTPVHGVAIGIPLQKASTGPFAQFQNSDDSEDALTQLVVQLVRRIPGSDPDRDVVRSQVAAFRTRAASLSASEQSSAQDVAKEDVTSVAKTFEEVKVMFQDLPARIAQNIDPGGPRSQVQRKMRYEMTFDLARSAVDMPGGVGILIAASLMREEFPWLADLAIDVHRKLSWRHHDAIESLAVLERMFDLCLDHPLGRQLRRRSREAGYHIEVVRNFAHHAIFQAKTWALGGVESSRVSKQVETDDEEQPL